MCDKCRSAQIHSKNPPEGTKMNELYKERRGASQMSEQFGPNLAPGPFALQQSIRLVYTLRASSRGRNRATRATRDNQDAHTERAHTLGNGDTMQQPAQDSEGELAVAAAAPPPPPPPPPPLLLLLLCCCCPAAASRLAMHRGAQPVTTDCFSFCVFWKARRSV